MIPAALSALLFAFLTAVAATLVILNVARSTGYVDRPGGHKQHDRPVALGGGIVITWTVCLPILAAVAAARFIVGDGPPEWLPDFIKPHVGGIALKAPEAVGIVAGAVVLHVTGLIDDRRPLGPGIKFAVQILVALFVAGALRVRLLEVLPAPFSIALTVLWIVLVINAFNFLDNMDGLSAGVAAIAGTIFALAAMNGGQIFVPCMMLLLVGALLGFLVFNFPPASLYMGDAGSLVVGYFLAVLTILTTFYNPEQQWMPAGVLLPIVVLAVPLYDVASVVWHRLRAGVSILRGDQRHFSHRLVQRGLSPRSAVLTIYLATTATALPAIMLPKADWPTAALIFAQCLCVVLMIAVLEHTAPPGSDKD